MADGSAIEWTDATWNPVAGCSRVSQGCVHCYAEREAHRLARLGGKVGEKYAGLTVLSTSGEPRWTGELRLWREHLDQPIRWRRPRRIFVNSMSDLFHESVPDTWIDQVFAVMMIAHQHTYQVLTKRPERMKEYLVTPGRFDRIVEHWYTFSDRVPAPVDWPLPNVWLGVSVENQKAADERIPLLLETPAAVRWISAEPLLGPLDLQPWIAPWSCMACGGRFSHAGERLNDGEPECPECGCPEFAGFGLAENAPGLTKLDWVVVGGESGPGARPMMTGWVRDLRDQCADADVAFMFKQWGEWVMGLGQRGGFINLTNGVNRAWSDGDCQEIGPAGHGYVVCRLGKRRAGRILDGRTWDEYPGMPTATEGRGTR